MNGKEARGMPNVELSIQTQEALQHQEEERAKEQIKIPQEQMFKGVEASAPPKAEQKKPKKKLTEAQLEALNRGRQKSIETRRAKKEAKLKEEAEWKAHQESVKKTTKQTKEYQPPPPEPVKSSADFVPTPTAPPQMYQQPNFSIDYDKLVNGVVEQMEHRSNARQEREHKVAEDLTAYEQQIREDERERFYKEMRLAEDEEKKKQNLVGATRALKHNYTTPNSLSTYQGSRQGRSRRVW